MSRFPTVEALAAAPLGDILTAWQGLGYNRRAKYLWQAANAVMTVHDGRMPATQVGLVTLPGVGLNTAGAIMAYAYDQPVVFIETNVRTVFIHHFFKDESDVHDRQLRPLIEATLPLDGGARQWYWALMDYGSYLKKTVGNLSRASTTYAKQSRFEGSRRQVRGAVLRTLAAGPASITALSAAVADDRLDDVLDDLGREGLISRQGDRVALYNG